MIGYEEEEIKKMIERIDDESAFTLHASQLLFAAEAYAA